MKKRLVASLLAMSMVASVLTGCGKGSEEAATTEDTEVVAEETKVESAASKLDDSKGRVVGPNSKWDGYFVDTCGVKIRVGMTINELIEQGCLVSPYYFTDDVDVIQKAATEMAVEPYTSNDVDGECMGIWMQQDGQWVRSDFSSDAWYYNPYPYAVPFGECVVCSLLPSKRSLPGEWDQDGDEKISEEDIRAMFDIEPIDSEYDNLIYPFEDGYVEFDLNEGNLFKLTSNCYGVHWFNEDWEKENFGPYEWLQVFEDASEQMDTSLDSYTFQMGLKKYTIDLSYFESIESFTRTYVKDSDYTSYIEIKGTTVDGDYGLFQIQDGGEDFYYKDIKNLYDNEETTSTGEVICAGYSGIYHKKAENNTIDLGVSISEKFNADHTYEMLNRLESLITAE